ncbi:ABC transporter permease [Clostridium sp. FP2]|uniref:ABC transporter permease n=1 Tax=Clostridium TaxID=1485 RepID=UPI0013E98216|nr:MULTISPECIES: ABC transporter permease [Clostridium]MBW9156874.1 ABC transporter permease [Clostridium tagluense]MBZ9622038.1 ABC transporter permease [Clostridium sp. FP2]WLC66351.1 ABC transporter permease [Clostridium tagluense]
MEVEGSDFEIVGENYISEEIKVAQKKSFKKNLKEKPYISIGVLLIIILGCTFSGEILKLNPGYMDLSNINVAPSSTFYFGTDSLGRDIFTMIWYGGKISLFIGVFATIISTTMAVVYGSISGVASELIDDMMMRFTEILLSIPSILIVIFIQAMIGKANPVSIAIVIGVTSWMNISKIVRSEVRKTRNSGYILAAKCAGGKFFYILKRHLIPNFISAIMFMVVTNVGSAIAIESTLSFLGIGLPLEIISWGSMLSLSEKALLSNYWWIILIPGIFLVVTLVCITNIGDYVRKKNNKEFSNL